MNTQLTQAHLHSLFEYRDGSLYWKNAPSKRIKAGAKAGRIGNRGYVQVGMNGKIYQAHRLIYCLHHGYFPDHIDHVDTNKLNNCIENLREANPSQNGYNRKVPSNNTSGAKGVSWHKNNKAWVVQLIVNGKHKNLGSFKDIELAELVAIEARSKFHKEFARNS